MVKKLLIMSGILLALAGCGGQVKQTAEQYHHFPFPSAPAMVQDESAGIEYMARNFWNAYMSQPGITDSAAISSVPNAEIEQAFTTYLSLLDRLPVEESGKFIAGLFEKTEERQARDSSSLFYLRFTEMVSRYLYDPNSPVRNEDYYLPFVEGMAASRFTGDDVRPGYEFEARMCAINRFGERVPDFEFTDADGTIRNLYGIKADWTLLFFSNPGCNACLEIQENLERINVLDTWISSRRLAVVNIYIDREIDKWREYEPNYPESWITGYDHRFRIREDILFNVRAIPSLYFLDSEKRVILKDATTEKAIDTICAKLTNKN